MAAHNRTQVAGSGCERAGDRQCCAFGVLLSTPGHGRRYFNEGASGPVRCG